MPFFKYMVLLKRMDALIRTRATGNPREFARKLGISERRLYDYLQEMKYDFGCPIEYDRHSVSYVYSKKGKLHIDLEFEVKEKGSRRRIPSER